MLSAATGNLFQEAIAPVVRQFEGGRDVLEVGCGGGVWLAAILEEARKNTRTQVRVVGLDLAENLLEVARERTAGGGAVELTCADFLRWESKQAFDLILFADTLQAFAYREHHAVVRKAAGLLRREGALVIVDKEILSWHSVFRRIRKRLGRWPSYYYFDWFPHFPYLERCGRQQGLQRACRLKRGVFTCLAMRRPQASGS